MMNLHMELMHRLLFCFYENPNKNYFGILDDMEIVNILVDMKLVEIFMHTLINSERKSSSLFIKVTPKGLLFIKSYKFNS